MAKALVNSAGKVLLHKGKVATTDSQSCCCTTPVVGGCCLPRPFNGTWQSRDRAFQNCSDEPDQQTCENLGGTWWTAYFDPNTSPPPVCEPPNGLPDFLLCCDSTPDLNITNCFSSVGISVTLNFTVTDDPISPTGCTEFSGEVTLSKSFTRVAVNPGNQPDDGEFYVATSEDACGWGIRGPFGGNFIVSDEDVNDQACDTPGTATLSVDVNLAFNFMIASFASTIECGGGACPFNPNGGGSIALGEFDFDSCTLGTHTFTGTDTTDRFSYTISVAVTLS